MTAAYVRILRAFGDAQKKERYHLQVVGKQMRSLQLLSCSKISRIRLNPCCYRPDCILQLCILTSNRIRLSIRIVRLRRQLREAM
jgi:hypothetical protein